MDRNVTENFFDHTQSVQLGDKIIRFRTVLPRKAKTWMALDMAESG